MPSSCTTPEVASGSRHEVLVRTGLTLRDIRYAALAASP